LDPSPLPAWPPWFVLLWIKALITFTNAFQTRMRMKSKKLLKKRYVNTKKTYPQNLGLKTCRDCRKFQEMFWCDLRDTCMQWQVIRPREYYCALQKNSLIPPDNMWM
jgi:hypothetical protein